MSLADQLKQSTAERLEAERRTVAAKQEERERRKTLDQVHWPSGDVSYGLVKTLGSEDDRFDIKLTIDRIRGDSSLSERVIFSKTYDASENFALHQHANSQTK